ncbi:glycosyltransferase family 39 protein [Plantactinospora sp. WMMB334]|uniref:glycosyltransferase family 39 protein n=1 Tax=Plantactinospora sp. WMMB334 TaxID=3404119 RepID=UPI003B93C752
MPGWTYRVVWLWPALVTLAITTTQLSRAPLWRDELATWGAASRPVGDLFRLTGNVDAVSGPYYLLMHFWIAVAGDSTVALRLPSALAMAGAAALTTLLGARLFGPFAGLVAGLLFAVLPSTSRYGQEARSYALVTLLAMLAGLLLLRAMDRPGWPRWAGYTAAVAGAGLAHLVAVLLVVGHALAVLTCRRPGILWRWAVAVGAAGLVLAPLAVLGRGQQGRQLGWVEQPDLTTLIGVPGALTQASAVGGLLLGLAAVAVANRGRPGVLLGLAVLLPVLLLFAAGQVTDLFVPRYLLFVVPLAAVLAAATLSTLRPPAVLAILVVTGLLGVPVQREFRRTHEWPRSAPLDFPAAVAIIAERQRPGDGIVYAPRTGIGRLDLATAYYLPGDPPRDVLLAEDPVRRADLSATECDRPAECLASAGVDRIWLLALGEQRDPLARMPADRADPLRAEFLVERQWTVPGLTVALLVPRPAG